MTPIARIPRTARRGRRKPRRRPEQIAGARLVAWIDGLVLEDGMLPGEYFAHIPNGGARTPIEGAILKGQGVRKGWPDYTLDIPRGRYHGMRLELKAEDGDKPDAEQLKILDRLEKQGYAVAICWGFTEARNAILRYLAEPAP